MLAIKDYLQKGWFLTFRLLCVIGIHLAYRIRIFGKENVPKDGPTLVLSNHQSFLDPLFCQSTIRRSFHFVARQSLFDVPVLGPPLQRLFLLWSPLFALPYQERVALDGAPAQPCLTRFANA